MAEDVRLSESTIVYVDTGQTYRTPPGSESMACNQRKQVNVGDPDSSSSSSKKYRLTSIICEEAEKTVRKSEGS